MIEISARLTRGYTFIAGEVVECCVTFTNRQDANQKKSYANNDILETLALASAQIHCQCNTSSKMIQQKHMVERDVSASNTDTSFAPCKSDSGYVVLATKPKILFCDLRLAAGESKSFLYREVLVNEAPPSYRGQAVKYSYKITIGAQRVNSPMKLLRIPLRVLVVSGLPDSSASNDSEELMPSNPFLETQQKDSSLDITLQMLLNVTARRSPNYYNITNVHGKVVRFCLFKQAYKLGEDIVGTFDFTDATVPCIQYSVTLQSEEEVRSDHKRSIKQGPSIVSYNKQHEICFSWKYLQLILPIPFHITPAFSTDLVSLQWRLHFEFVTSVSSTPSTSSVDTANQAVLDQNDRAWQGPSSFNIETMIWNLPIQILPTTPQFVTQGFYANARHSILI